LPFDGVIEELFGKAADGLFGFGQDHQPAGVLIDAMHQAEAGKVCSVMELFFCSRYQATPLISVPE